MSNASTNLITYILKFSNAIYQMLYGTAISIMRWFETFENVSGFNPLELMLGAGLIFVLGYILTKWIIGIITG